MNPKVNTSNKPNIDECHNNCNKIVLKQPISCRWSHSQTCPLSPNKNSLGDLSSDKTTPSSESSTVTSSPSTNPTESLHQSSSQFFYFLRLMQLFPETHPATLHTVLSLCKNDFFCAVDKLLYARRCKSVLRRNQTEGIRRHPFCRGHSYYCYTSESCKGTKRPWDVDHVTQEIQQETTQLRKTAEPPNTRNKEVLDLTIKNEAEKSPAFGTSIESNESITIANSPAPNSRQNLQSNFI